MDTLIYIVIFGAFIFALIGYFVAENKGVEPAAGAALGFFLGPIGLIVTALLNPPRSTAAINHFYNGRRDLSDDRYRHWLTKRYHIEHNGTLNLFVVGSRTFTDLERALRHAHIMEDIRMEEEC